MAKKKLIHAAKWWLKNFECNVCSTGVVQVKQTWAKGGVVTTNVSGCLDCGYEFGINQISNLKPYTREDTTWP